MSEQLDWTLVQFFVTVVESGGIAQAAQRLGVNHSTILRRIAQLEDRLACRLFDRLPSGYVLTANGDALAQRLAGLTDQVESAQRQLTGLDTSLEGTIRIASSDIVVEGLLMPLLAELRSLHPRLELQLVTSYRFTELTPREADIAVRGADRAPKNLIAQYVGEIETVMCASQKYLTRAGPDRRLAEHRWVALDSSLTFPLLESWMRKHVTPQQIALRVDSLVGAADAVAAGIGLGLLPHPLVVARRALVQLGRPEAGLEKKIWVLMHPEVQRNVRARTLFNFLCQGLSSDSRLAHHVSL